MKQDNKLNEMKKKYAYFIELNKIYLPKYQELENTIKEKAHHSEYSKGGLTIHRGYYCPSPVQNIIIGKNSRGKLLKKFNNKYDYEYVFDNNNKLLKSIKKDSFLPPEEEYVIYDNNINLGLTFYQFQGFRELKQISQCKYLDDKIIKYDFVVFSFDDNINQSIHEEYEYENNLLKKVNHYNIYNFEQSAHFTHLRYYFKRDEEGYMTTFAGGEVKDGIIENEYTCDIKVKRK